jgi:hypothetical protein
MLKIGELEMISHSIAKTQLPYPLRRQISGGISARSQTGSLLCVVQRSCLSIFPGMKTTYFTMGHCWVIVHPLAVTTALRFLLSNHKLSRLRDSITAFNR